MPFCLVKVDFFETRKPENPNELNPNPKADFSIKSEPDQTRNFFCNMMPFYLLKFDFFETRKPENPKGLNPNPKVDFSFEPEPDQTRNLFSN